MNAKHLRIPLVVALLAVLSACGGGSGRTDSSPKTTAPAATTPTSAAAGLRPDPDHTYRLVNLHLFNGAPGAAVDIMPATASDLTTLGGTPTALAAGLGYGQATDALPPGAVPSPLGTLRYGLSVRPHDAGQPGAANLTIDINDSSDGADWHRGVVVLGGTGNGLQTTAFYDSGGPTTTNPVPATAAGKVALKIDAQYAGDPDGPSPVNATIVAGTTGGCLTTDGGTAAAVTPGGISDAFIAVDPSVTTLDFWLAAGCSGKPAFSASLSGLAAGGRALVFVYGPDADHLAAVVVPLSG